MKSMITNEDFFFWGGIVITMTMMQAVVHRAEQDGRNCRALCWPILLDPEIGCPNDAAMGGRAPLHAAPVRLAKYVATITCIIWGARVFSKIIAAERWRA